MAAGSELLWKGKANAGEGNVFNFKDGGVFAFYNDLKFTFYFAGDGFLSCWRLPCSVVTVIPSIVGYFTLFNVYRRQWVVL